MESLPGWRSRRFDSGGPSLDEVGETELLRRLGELARAVGGAADLVVPSGDDAAVWRPPPGADVAISQDALVEGEDFRRDWISPAQLGGRALQVALSDLAATGATPMLCLATICAPGTTGLEDVLAIQRGFCAGASAAGCRVAGGDVSAIDGPLVLDVVVIGIADHGLVLRRDAGRPGDWLLVTGHLGRAAAGLQLLLGGASGPEGVADRWRAAQITPEARIAEGRALVERGVRCGGDLSDGLLVDAGRLLDASGCGGEIWLDRIPADAELRDFLGDRWAEVVLGGGEDFELIAAVPPDRLPVLLAGWPDHLAALQVVGRLDAGPGLRLRGSEDGEPVAVPRILSRHFAP